jgi:RND family efflux transporter MFP subunit
VLRFLLLAATLSPLAFAQPPATGVLARPFAEIALHPVREAPAQVLSLNEARLAAEIAGRVLEIRAEVGQVLPRGALVARLDCADHELALERAAAAAAAARSRVLLAGQQLARGRELEQQGFFSREALAQRETELSVLHADAAQTDAARASAALAVGKCELRAPFVAIVRQRLAAVGDLAAPGAALVAVSDASRIEVAAQVQLRDADTLVRAGALHFVADGAQHEVRLLRVSPAVSREARTVEVRLALQRPATAMPGLDGRLRWRDPRPHLPAAALVRRGEALGVFVLQDGTARFVTIAGAQEGRPAAAELAPQARVVVAGQRALRDGERPGAAQ